ncbi:hypothetical protein ACFVTP_08910 [Streptomyces celluloflavus]|uniref:hypothetical protein n=1 Tax=Streptomyces celluloflavus TaxID=58344 RepID=UPI0036D8509D
MKPQVGWPTRTVVTFLGLCHLTLVAAVPSAVALSTSIGNDGWVLWFFVPLNVFMHLTVASVFGSRQLGTVLFAWIVPLFTIGLTTLSGMMLNQRWPADWPRPGSCCRRSSPSASQS